MFRQTGQSDNFGNFRLAMALPGDCRADEVGASFGNGCLMIRMPRACSMGLPTKRPRRHPMMHLHARRRPLFSPLLGSCWDGASDGYGRRRYPLW